jgi:hypothetical protein
MPKVKRCFCRIDQQAKVNSYNNYIALEPFIFLPAFPSSKQTVKFDDSWNVNIHY